MYKLSNLVRDQLWTTNTASKEWRQDIFLLKNSKKKSTKSWDNWLEIHPCMKPSLKSLLFKYYSLNSGNAQDDGKKCQHRSQKWSQVNRWESLPQVLNRIQRSHGAIDWKGNGDQFDPIRVQPGRKQWEDHRRRISKVKWWSYRLWQLNWFKGGTYFRAAATFDQSNAIPKKRMNGWSE